VKGLAPALLLAAACASVPEHRPAPTAATTPAPGRARPGYGDETPALRDPFDRRARAEVLATLGRKGPAPLGSAALDRAAALLARAVARGEPDPLARGRLQAALRLAAAFDPAPRAHAVSGSDDEALAALLARLTPGEASHVGIGSEIAGERRHVVVLLSRRRIRLEPFPSSVEPGGAARLAGTLVGLLHPRLFVTRPDGETAEVALEGGAAFSARVPFAARGTHLLEVTGTGAAGTEVAALLAVAAGSALPDPTGEAGPPPPDPTDPGASEEAIVAAVNRLRRDRGLAPVEASPALAAVARAHSERMLSAGTVAHVLPGSGELAGRLSAARIPFGRAFENVARGERPFAAHAAAEASPAHRANLLVPGATAIGVGIARGALPSGEPIAYLTEVLVERAPADEPDRLTPEARVREALWRERGRRALPPLTDDPALAAIAAETARAARGADAGDTKPPAEAALRLGRGLAAADAFVAADPSEATRSRNLTDPRFRRVGVGVVRGDSRRYGPGRLFIAVVYSD
jgi:uncharacterized protein YkwD